MEWNATFFLSLPSPSARLDKTTDNKKLNPAMPRYLYEKIIKRNFTISCSPLIYLRINICFQS